ncbi:hypothetical protein OB920_11405 [Halobacteria archaeon HArc-gm2]|nr:hypothetical protein [Halobacteria archaeon HArc-gm2]
MVPNDRLFDALAHRQRRLLLLDLLDHEPRAVPRLSSASREIAAANDAYLAEYLSSAIEIPDVDKAAVRVHHVHLPKLVDYRYVEWDEEAHVVSRGADFDDLRPLLELLEDDRDDASDPAVPLLVRGDHRRRVPESSSNR